MQKYEPKRKPAVYCNGPFTPPEATRRDSLVASGRALCKLSIAQTPILRFVVDFLYDKSYDLTNPQQTECWYIRTAMRFTQDGDQSISSSIDSTTLIIHHSAMHSFTPNLKPSFPLFLPSVAFIFLSRTDSADPRTVIIDTSEHIFVFNFNNNKIGRRITTITEDTRETTFLFQRLSMALQRGNAVSFHNTMVTE